MNTLVVFDSYLNLENFKTTLDCYSITEYPSRIVATDKQNMSYTFHLLDVYDWENDKNKFWGMPFDNIEMYVTDKADIAFEIYNKIYLPNKMIQSGYPFLPIDGSDNAAKDIEFDDGYYTLPKDTQLDFTGLTYPEFQKQFQGNWSDSVTKECEHDWKEYVGLVESYKYCSKCDKKE